MAGGYPQREKFFAHRFTRLLTKTAVAQELGHLTCWLLTIIVHQEDAKRYSRGVTFYNDKLMDLAGVKKWDTLDRARKVAMEEGWLHYESKGRRRPGVYWVTIPEWAAAFDDAPVDDGTYPTNGGNAGIEAGIERVQCGGQSGDNMGEPSSLSPNPNPNPKTNTPADAETSGRNHQSVELDSERASIDQTDEEIVFLAAWEAAEGRRRHPDAGLVDNRRRHFQRLVSTPGWDWRAALAKFPLQVFGRAGPGDWLPTIGWFLKEDTVYDILEGKYDFTPHGKRGKDRLAALAEYMGGDE